LASYSPSPQMIRLLFTSLFKWFGFLFCLSAFLFHFSVLIYHFSAYPPILYFLV
jgi:hypothetical protein